MKSAISFVIMILLLIIGVIGLGFVGSSYFSNRIMQAQREQHLIEAKQAALLVSATDIASLSASNADLANPVYQRLKSSLMHFRQTNPDIQYVYVTGYRQDEHTNRRFFYVDSEPTTSDTYAAPGLGFDTSDEAGDVQKFLAGESYVDGPYEGKNGTWEGAYAPVKSMGGTVVAMVGVDMPTSVANDQLAFARIAISVVAALLCLLLIVISGSIFRKMRSDAVRAEEEAPARGKLKYMEQIAPLGTFIIAFPDLSVTLDPQFQPLFKKTSMSMEAFSTFIHMEDQEKYEAMLRDVSSSNIVYSWVDVRIGTEELGFRKYHIYGNIERHASGSAERFDGVMQDITDGK